MDGSARVTPQRSSSARRCGSPARRGCDSPGKTGTGVWRWSRPTASTGTWTSRSAAELDQLRDRVRREEPEPGSDPFLLWPEDPRDLPLELERRALRSV